jgi:hypothetical protein
MSIQGIVKQKWPVARSSLESITDLQKVGENFMKKGTTAN